LADRRARVLAEARLWLGTPYCHQASLRGAGADCLGLVRGLWRALHGTDPAGIPPYGPDWAETGRDEALWQALSHLMRPAGPTLEPGDILLFRMRAASVAKHLGVLTATGPDARFIHAYSGHGVVESPLSTPWARRIVARFDLT